MKRKLIITLVLLTGILAAVAYGVLNYSYSKGTRSGKLVKLSKKGFFPKTYEGTLDLGSGDQLTWQFSIHNDKIGEELAKLNGKTVSLEYRELLYKVYFDTKYDVTSFKRVSEYDGEDNLCRLVTIVRKNAKVVEVLKPLIEKYDIELLDKIRDCQE